MGYTADDLISSTRRRGMLPTYDEGASAALLATLNDEQWLYLAALLAGAAENYRTATASITLTSALTYPLPVRAVTAGIKMLQFTNSAGTVWAAYELRPEDWPAAGGVWPSPCNRFYLQGNNIIFYAAPPAGTLTVTYPLRMSELVLSTDTANVRAITLINTGTKTVALSGAFTNAAGLCDLVKATPHFDILSMEASFTGSGTATLVFTNTLPTGLAVGDYVCIPGKSPVCQAPLELHQVLCQRAAYATLQAKGDAKTAAVLEQLGQMERRAVALLQPRPGRARSIINYNAPGWGRWGWGPYWRGP